jgi:hypothetical protein
MICSYRIDPPSFTCFTICCHEQKLLASSKRPRLCCCSSRIVITLIVTRITLAQVGASHQDCCGGLWYLSNSDDVLSSILLLDCQVRRITIENSDRGVYAWSSSVILVSASHETITCDCGIKRVQCSMLYKIMILKPVLPKSALTRVNDLSRRCSSLAIFNAGRHA